MMRPQRKRKKQCFVKGINLATVVFSEFFKKPDAIKMRSIVILN
jgi:hypothetical protein